MSSDDPIPGKIEVGGRGLGLVDPAMIDQRAAELARSDGRTEFDDRDLEEARLELLGEQEPPEAPEIVEPESETAVAWNEPVTDSGSKAPTVGPMDEQTVAEHLVQEGIEEADHDLRRSAGEEASGEES